MANYGRLPVVSQCVSGCTKEGISVGEDESEISPVTPRERRKGGGRISNPDQTETLVMTSPLLPRPELAQETQHAHAYEQRDGSKLASGSTRSRYVSELSQALTHTHGHSF